MDVSGVAPFSTVECPDCATRQKVPMRLGSFLLLEVLGKGGMGVVYRALDQSLGRYVAIKVMRRALGEDKQFVENFFREARAAAALNHRNVVQIYSCGEERGQPYIVMELVGGGRLDATISNGNMMDEVRALEIGVDIAEGLKAANDVGLIHGDIKPANILFDKHGTAKVVDFGLARFMSWKEEAPPTEIWGTPYYIAPEKARGQKVDHRSDIYSLGATLYHALGAKPPFDGETASEVVLARLRNPAIGLRVIRPTLQPETADVISRMLEGDPFMRYPTYASLLADLREALRVAKQEHRTLHKKVQKSAAAPFIVAGVVVLALFALLVGAFQVNRKAQSRKKARVAPRVVQKTSQSVEEGRALPDDAPVTRVAPVVQPFKKQWGKQIGDIAYLLPRGKSLAVEEQLQALHDQIPKGSMARYWVRLFQAVPCWWDGRDDAAEVYLAEILDAPFKTKDPEQPHPGDFLRAIVQHILEGGDEGPLYIQAGRWPPWMGDLLEFFLGITRLREDRIGEAHSHLATYVEKDPEGPAWAYSMRPIAEELLQQQEKWTRILENVERMVSAGDASGARTTLETFQAQACVLFDPLVNRAMQTVREAEMTAAEDEARAQRMAHRQRVQADLDILDELRTANLKLLARKEYRKASAALSKALPRMATTEGQEAFQVQHEAYERMNGLKRFLIDSVERKRFTQRGELGGTAVGANLSGVRVSLGGHGVMVKPWDQVSVRLMLQMANYYINAFDLPADEEGDILLSLSVFCYYNGGFNAASKYADKAVEINPTLKTETRRLMPDVLPD
jgi:serine/threonine protein kinase/tetratricopeptide (TPR) repeat protein